MVIVAGHVMVEPWDRESYLEGCPAIVERARTADGCLDCAIAADPIDPGRVNIFERWTSREALEIHRGGDPDPGEERSAAMLSVSVAEYDIAEVRPLFGGDEE